MGGGPEFGKGPVGQQGSADPPLPERVRVKVNNRVHLHASMSSGRRSVVRGSALTVRIRKDLDLLRRHVTLLKAVEEHQPIGIIRLAKLSGHPQHHIRYTLRILEHEGLVRPSQEGAVTTTKAKRFREKLRVLLEEMKRTVESLRNSL